MVKSTRTANTYHVFVIRESFIGHQQIQTILPARKQFNKCSASSFGLHFVDDSEMVVSEEDAEVELGQVFVQLLEPVSCQLRFGRFQEMLVHNR